MPIYEYRCQACGHQFEKIQKLSDRPLRQCPECKGHVEKIVSLSSFALKGGGWYAQGYSNGKSGKTTESSGSKDSGSSTKSGASD